MKSHVRVGGLQIPIEQARSWVRDYLDSAQNQVAKSPYAFPAYDKYTTGADANALDDGDLMEPGLLNVPVNIRTFYSLQSCRDDVAAALSNIKITQELQRSTDSEIADMVEPLYAVLDRTPRPPGVKSTLLSKVLHRKRPNFLVIHDTWVRHCYVMAADAPVTRDRRQSSSAYMVAISTAIAHDLQDQDSVWNDLAAASNAEADRVSIVRTLDIVAWHAGQIPV